MFKIFESDSGVKEAKILFGSKEESRENFIEIKNPFTKEVVSRYPVCSEADAKRALEIANEAFKETSTSLLSQRIAWLEDVAKKLREREEEFAKLIVDEVAKPIHFARIEAQRCAETIEATAKELIRFTGETIPTDAMASGRKSLAYYKRVPAGVVVAITPFNFPLNLVAHKIAPALGIGNSVVLKPTPEAPVCAYELAKLFIESKYAIKDALSVVYGDAEVGSALVKSPIPRVISFTGSVPVGKIISKNAGLKKVALELGGNAATFIEKSANIEDAAKKCAYGSFYNSGQVCISLQRIYVHKDIYEEFADAMAKETKKFKVGSPYDDDTFMGPLINEDAKHRAKSWVASAIDEGARVICGGEEVDGIFPPTIMADVTDDMKIVCEEVFAPIVSLVKVDSYEEAINKINSSPYGLQYSIFTNDLKLATKFIDDAQAGGVVINDIPTVRFDIQPYGGVKQSGIGREGPRWALEEFSEIKSVVIF
ncbi:MAG: aldehyde dehydrogenase family protein [Epsilonproteobacteria bacterium]|nr:aldehyde dehydrogenase family protein [Campylobacterota bacterium]